MAANDIELGEWENQVREVALPRVRVNAKGSATLLGAAVVFATVCIVVPQKMVSHVMAGPVNVSPQLDDLKQEIDLLKDEKLADQAKLAELDQKFEAANGALRRYKNNLEKHQQNWNRACRSSGATLLTVCAEDAVVAGFKLDEFIAKGVLRVL